MKTQFIIHVFALFERQPESPYLMDPMLPAGTIWVIDSYEAAEAIIETLEPGIYQIVKVFIQPVPDAEPTQPEQTESSTQEPFPSAINHQVNPAIQTPGAGYPSGPPAGFITRKPRKRH